MRAKKFVCRLLAMLLLAGVSFISCGNSSKAKADSELTTQYALKAVSDRCLTRAMTANRRNVPPLAGEVIQVPKYTCLFAA